MSEQSPSVTPQEPKSPLESIQRAVQATRRVLRAGELVKEQREREQSDVPLRKV